MFLSSLHRVLGDPPPRTGARALHGSVPSVHTVGAAEAPHTFESVRPPMYCSGVSVVFWSKCIVDMSSSVTLQCGPSSGGPERAVVRRGEAEVVMGLRSRERQDVAPGVECRPRSRGRRGIAGGGEVRPRCAHG